MRPRSPDMRHFTDTLHNSTRVIYPCLPGFLMDYHNVGEALIIIMKYERVPIYGQKWPSH